MKSITQVPHPQQQEHHHAEADEEVMTLQQQHYSTDDSVLSEGGQQQEEAPATWQLGEEAAAVAAAAAAVEGGVEKELVAAAERTAAGTVKSRGRGSPRLRLFIMRQCSEGGVNSRAEDPAAVVAAALGAAAVESGAPAEAGELLKTKEGRTAAGTATAGGKECCGSGSSGREAAGEEIAAAERRARQEALQQSSKLLLAEGAAAAAAADLAGADGRPRTHHHHHLLLHPDDDEEEEDKHAAPNQSTCSNKAWSRRRDSKQELMSISAADRDRLLLDTGHSLEEVEERWWKGYFGDLEDMQRTRTRIAARRRTLEDLLQQQKQEQQEGQQQAGEGEEKHGEGGARRRGELSGAEQSEEARGKQGRPQEQEERREGAAATEQQQQQEHHEEVEEEHRRRPRGEGLLTVQSWWEEVVETETGRSFVAAAGHGGDASRLRLSYKEIDGCANAVALWAVVTAAGMQRCSTVSTRWTDGSRGSSMSSCTAGDGPTSAELSSSAEKQYQQPQQEQHVQTEGAKKEAEEQHLPSHEAGARPSLDGSVAWWRGLEGGSSSVGHSGATRVPLQPNDVVVLLMSHPFECLLLLLGLLKTNLIPALVPTHLRGEALEDAVHAAAPAYIIADSENLKKLYAAVRRSSLHRGHGSSSTTGDRDSSALSEGESEGDSSSKDRGTIPAVGRTFFMEGGGETEAGETSDAPVDLLAGASACAAWFGCPTSLYAPPVAGGGGSGPAGAATTATPTTGEKCLLTEIDAALALCGVACEASSSSSREAAALCGVALPPQCPPLREVLHISAAVRLACKGNSPCLSCLRRDAPPAVAAAAVKLVSGAAGASPVVLPNVEDKATSGRSAAPAERGAKAPSGGAVATSEAGDGQGSTRSSGWHSSNTCVYRRGHSAAAAAASCEVSQWGALHPAVYFYATVPVARGMGSSRWRRATAAERADAEAAEGIIERGVGGKEAEDAEEVEQSLQPALLSHETLISIGIAWRRRMQLDVGDVVYCPASLQAETGCLPAVLAALEARASLVFPRAFDARSFWSHIDCFRCTYTTYFPSMWRRLFAGDHDDMALLPAEGASAVSLAASKGQAQQEPTPQRQEEEEQQQQQEQKQQQQRLKEEGGPEAPRRRLRGCAGEGMTAEWWQRIKQEAGESLRDFVEYHFRPHWPVSSPLINYTKKMHACGFVPNSVQGKRATARLVRYDQRRRMVLRRPDSGRCFEAELRSKQEHRTGEAIVRLEKHQTWLGFVNADVTRSLLLENAFTGGDLWCRSGDLMNVDRLGFFYFVETLG